MTIRTHVLAAAAAIGSMAAPAAAQYYPQQPTYPQQYPQYQQQYQQQYPQGYQQQVYGQQVYGQQGYAQGYSQNPIQSIIDSLLGNRYTVTDRQAVSRCASAAMTQAAAQFGGGYNRGGMRVTAITDVQRRGNGLRVSGTMSSGYGGQYGNQYGGYGGYDREHGYQNGGYGQNYAASNLSFRCNVAYNGAVTGVRIGRNNGYRG